jgi:hypothetical protein
MDLKKNIDYSEIQKLEIVVRDLMDELKLISKSNRDIIESINHLSVKISSFNEKLENIEITAPEIDTQPIRDMLTKAMLNIAAMIHNKPKDNSRKLRILPMLPEDSKRFFKMIFGCFLCTAITIIVINVSQWAIQQSVSSTKIELERIKNNNVQKAWKYLYEQKNKNVHRQMDSALIRASLDGFGYK